MGFRNPVTSVSAVDTGRGIADPGVRILTDTTYPGTPQGIVEWRTGLMSRNARATLSGGSNGGSAFTLDGGQILGNVNAPMVALDVESQQAGGFAPVLRLTAGAGGQIILDQPITVLQHAALAYFGAGWRDYAQADTSWGHSRVWLAADGTVHLTGMSQNVTGGAQPGSDFASIPAWARPIKNVMLTGCTDATFNGHTAVRIDVKPNGSIAYANATMPNGAWWAFNGAWRLDDTP